MAPVVFFKLQLMMFFEGLRSERQLQRVWIEPLFATAKDWHGRSEEVSAQAAEEGKRWGASDRGRTERREVGHRSLSRSSSLDADVSYGLPYRQAVQATTDSANIVDRMGSSRYQSGSEGGSPSNIRG